MSKPPTRLICPLTKGSVQSMRSDMAVAAKLGADTVECRLDFLEATPTRRDLQALLVGCPLPAIVTCRPRREGGYFKGDESQRLGILRDAASFKPAFIDIEIDVPRSDWPDGNIILSHHEFNGAPDDLDEIVAKLDRSDAAINKVAFSADGPEDAFRALDILRLCNKPTLALAMGEHGLASRLLAAKFGAFGAYATLDASTISAPGQPTIDQFCRLYHANSIGPDTTVYGVVGSPIAHSMSPAIHNAAFQQAGIDGIYIPLRVEPGSNNFTRFTDALATRPWLGLHGLSVTIPHKENALAYAKANNCDNLAVKIGAVNTVTFQDNGKCHGDNTDYAAAIDALCNTMNIEREGLAGKSVAVIGAGGVSRAIVAGLAHYGAEIIIYNRTVSRGEKLANEFACRWAPLDALRDTRAEIIINCTSVGMHPKVEAAPLERIPASVKVVFDTIYNPIETRLLAEARASRCLCVTGLDMFVNQAVAQFELWTKRPAPREMMRQVVMDCLSGRE